MNDDLAVEIMAQLSDIRSLATAANTKIEGLDKRLFNGGAGVIATLQSDIQQINDDRKDEKRWERIHNTVHYALSPLLIIGHAVLRHFGVNV